MTGLVLFVGGVFFALGVAALTTLVLMLAAEDMTEDQRLVVEKLLGESAEEREWSRWC